MSSGRPASGALRHHDGEPQDGDQPPSPRPGIVQTLERRLLVALAMAVAIVAAGYAWLQPALGGVEDREAVMLALFSLLSLLTVTALGLLVVAVSRIREGFERRDEARDRLVQAAETDAERLEAYSRRLEQRNEDLRRFAYVVAHDLREPARTVATHARLAQREAEDLDKTARENLDAAVRAAKHLDDLLGDLLAYVTLESQVGEAERVDLDEALADALRRLEADVGSEAKVEAEPLGTVRGYRTALVRLFEELLSNAIKFSPEDEVARVEIRTRGEDHEVVLEVEDDGIGMDPDLADRAFGMFERLHPRNEIPGTGAGLSICQRVARLHDGRIDVDAEPGDGCTFRIALPRRGPEEPAFPSSQGEAHLTSELRGD